MARALLSPTLILDETPGVVRRLADPWLGVFWLSNIPLRLLQAHFFREAGALGKEASHFGDYLSLLAFPILIALPLAIFGRAIYLRACFLSLQSGGRVGREAWKVAPGIVANSLYVGLLSEILFFALMWTYIFLPFAIVFAGIAAVVAHQSPRPSVIKPLTDLAPWFSNLKTIIALVFTYGIGLLVAIANLFMASGMVLWALGGFAGADLSRWDHLLRGFILPFDPLIRWICIAGGVLLVEPFWLTSIAMMVHRSKLSESGEDLQVWFRKITQP